MYSIPFHLLLSPPVLEIIPPREIISHTTEISSSSNNYRNDVGTRSVPIVKTTAVSIRPGLHPIPLNIVNIIETGHFIDMDELLPERLGCPIAR